MNFSKENTCREAIIAHFSIARLAFWISVNLALFVALYFAILMPVAGQSFTAHLLSPKGLFDPLTLVGVLMTPFWVILIFVMLRQMILREGTAIWISNSRLFFLNFYGAVTFSSISLQKIASFSVGSTKFLQPIGIIINLINGDKRYLPTLLLREKREAIISRLISFQTSK